MGLIQKLFGVSQREAWATAAYKLGGKTIQGNLMEADQIEFYFLGKKVKVFISTKGDPSFNGVYTVVETTFSSPYPINMKEDILKTMKIDVVKIKEGMETIYWLRHREIGIVKEEELILKNCLNFKNALDLVLNESV